MNQFRNYVLMTAGFVVLVMVVGVCSAGTAIAQAVRAALVSNVDDPGRIPYRVQVQINCFPPFNNSCEVAAVHPVLPGKRLVITNVTGEVDTAAPGGTQITLNVDASIGEAIIPMTFSGLDHNRFNHYGFNQQVLLFYDAGEAPKARIDLDGSYSISVSTVMSGYLLDCTTVPCASISQSFN